METASDFNNSNLYASPLHLCPLCSSQNIKKKYCIRNYSHAFRVDECIDCKFIFMNPRFNEDTIRSMYNNEYYCGTAEYSYYDERKAENYSGFVWEKRIKIIRKYIKSGNFLDVGCAFGGFLKKASVYFIPHGVELSEYSGKHAKAMFGENIHIGTLNKHPFESGYFSVITMIELIEHAADPVFLLNESYKLLRKGGLLLIQTANMNGMQAKLLKDNYAMYMPGHLSYFTRHNLTELLRKIGFGKIQVFFPVEFGLLPKLLKSRYNFNSAADYLKWLRIGFYHYISKLRFGDFAATSSMVIYAIK